MNYKDLPKLGCPRTIEQRICDLQYQIDILREEMLTSWTNAGEWSATTNYNQPNIYVTSNGSSYLRRTMGDCIGLAPENNPDYWQLVAEGGKDGEESLITITLITPDYNINNLPLTLFNRTPKIGEYFTAIDTDGFETWLKVTQLTATNVISETQNVLQIRGDNGTPGATGAAALVPNVIFTTSDDTPPAVLPFVASNFNRTPKAGDTFTCTVNTASGQFICVYSVVANGTTGSLEADLEQDVAIASGGGGAVPKFHKVNGQKSAAADALIVIEPVEGTITEDIEGALFISVSYALNEEVQPYLYALTLPIKMHLIDEESTYDWAIPTPQSGGVLSQGFAARIGISPNENKIYVNIVEPTTPQSALVHSVKSTTFYGTL